MAEAAAAAGVAVPHLDDGIVSEILLRLPTKDAYRLAAVCRPLLSSPTFLCRHLSPRPLPLLDDGPSAFVVQPRGKVRYTHLTVVATDPHDRRVAAVTLPVPDKYKDARPASPPPRPIKKAMLDICFVASHGRLLLARYHVCDPAANRWVVLPPSTIPPASDANAGIHYEVDASTGSLTAFTVVQLLRRRLRRGLVETFSSTTGEWDARELRAEGVARSLGAASPGVHVGSCFYWLSRRQGRVVRYDADRDRAAVLREPPLAEKAVQRLGRSLGSVDGTGVRLCAFDIRDEETRSMLPHDGVEGVWFLEEEEVSATAPPWRRVHEAVVEGLSVWYFLSMLRSEIPVDFPGASGDFVVLDQSRRLLRYDLESGRKVQLSGLYSETSRLGALYRRFHAFPFFG